MVSEKRHGVTEMIRVYFKQPFQAEQFDGSDEMIDKYDIINTQLASTAMGFEGAYFLPTMEGELRVNIGDWIASGVEDESWAIADDVFKKTYAELPVIPKAVGDWIDRCKANMIAIGGAMNEPDLPEKVADYFRKYHTREQWIKIQDDFVRAWLDGYQVES